MLNYFSSFLSLSYICNMCTMNIMYILYISLLKHSPSIHSLHIFAYKTGYSEVNHSSASPLRSVLLVAALLLLFGFLNISSSPLAVHGRRYHQYVSILCEMWLQLLNPCRSITCLFTFSHPSTPLFVFCFFVSVFVCFSSLILL